jgi:signal peptidase II
MRNLTRLGLVADGQVTDFLNVGIGSVRTGIFNVADVVVVMGLAVLVLSATRAAAAK